MGLSSNQARFLSLTARQVDLENRIQQICQRRLRLSSELENVATQYNNQISNRKMFTAAQASQGISELSLENLAALGYRVNVNGTQKILGETLLKKGVETVTALKSPGQIAINDTAEFMNIVNQMNANNATALDGDYILMGDIDLTSIGPKNTALITKVFTGSLDGNGYTISGLNIAGAENHTDADGIGLFSTIAGDAKISNLVLSDFNVSTTNSNTGALAGLVNSSAVVIDNVSSINSNVSNPTTSGDSHRATGGLVGRINDGTIINSYTSGSVGGGYYVGGLAGWVTGGRVDVCSSDADVNATGDYVGGLVGEVYTTGGTASIISRSYATGDVSSAGKFVGGLIGKSYRTAQDCYATGNVTGYDGVGGLVGLTVTSYTNGTGALIDSYASGHVTATGTAVGGLVGTHYNGATIKNSFWFASTGQANGYTHENMGNAEATPVLSGNSMVADMADLQVKAAAANWSTNIAYPDGGSWDTSKNPPELYKPTGYVIDYTSDMLEEGLRSGKYSLLRAADEYTQDSIGINGTEYEEADWRTVPQIYDELYKGDDVAAEDKYDKIVSEINAQDKKLQLEQTSIEVQYKAIASERESVKKILDTNAQASFKYFS